jgi:D-3-phosphoglycerate dehydrogenase
MAGAAPIMTRRPLVALTHTPHMRESYFGVRALTALRSFADVRLHEGAGVIGDHELAVLADGADILITDRATPIGAERVSLLRTAVAVLRVAVDVRNIDAEAASRAGILVCRASRTWVSSVSEMLIGLMIDAARGISRANIAYKAGRQPQIVMGRQLAGSTAGIIGFGPLGRRVAELCVAFGMDVLVHDPYVDVALAGVSPATFDEVCRRADFLLPLAVATEETENLIGQRAFSMMKRGAVLVNLSRGNLVDEVALETALNEGRICAAALDVGRAPDQMPSPHLAARADVTATPHIGGLTIEAIEGQALEVVEQARTIFGGVVPPGAVDPAATARLSNLRNRTT